MKQYSKLQSWRKNGNNIIRTQTILLVSLFLFYWIWPVSRTAHLNREGSIQIPTLKILLPIIIFIVTLVSSYYFLSSKSRILSLRPFSSVHVPNIFFTSLVVFPAFLSLFSIDTIYRIYFSIFRISYLSPIFGDLRTILYGISCETVDSLGDTIDCDPRPSPTIWNYPTFLLKLRGIGVSIDVLPYWTILTTMLVVAAIHLVSARLSSISRAIFSVAVSSPPMILCYERMNFDLIIVSILILSAAVLERYKGSLLATIVAFSGVAVATSLKFYAAPVFVIALFYIWKRNKINAVVGFCISSAILFLLLPDFTILSEYVGKDLRGSVGFSVIVGLLNGSNFANYDISSVGFFVLLFSLLFSLEIMRRYMRTYRYELQINQVVLFPLFSFLVTWFSSSSYYYRLLLLVFIVPFLVEIGDRFTLWVAFLSISTFFYSPSSLAIVLNLFLLPIVTFGSILVVKQIGISKIELGRAKVL